MSGWEGRQLGKRPALELGIEDPAGLKQVGHLLGNPGRVEPIEVLKPVQVGTQQLEIAFFDEIVRELLGLFAIMPAEGEEVELEKTAGIP